MILKLGSKGEKVKLVQQFLKVLVDGDFGPGTEKAVKQWQKLNGLVVDGIVGPSTTIKMGLVGPEKFDTKYKGVTIKGSVFPDKPIKDNLRVRLSKEIREEYLPALEIAMKGYPKGLKLLCTIMAHKEGFKKGTRSYRTNNPGNIGNTDRGANKKNFTLVDGLTLQKEYILKIIIGRHNAYPVGERKVIKPYYSPEIAKHTKLYGMSPYVPGYDFIFTGQLDQFVKIYSTGARAGNGYLSMIISYFKEKGININAQSKLKDVVTLKT